MRNSYGVEENGVFLWWSQKVIMYGEPTRRIKTVALTYFYLASLYFTLYFTFILLLFCFYFQDYL